MAAVAVKYPAFQELNTEVLAVSVDSVDSHRRWQEQELSQMVRGGVIFPMLSDPGGKIGTLYGIYDEEKKVDNRAWFLIDSEGKIQAIEIISDIAGRNLAEILRQLRALQHYEATGELMPCGWQPGKPTLPAGPDAAKREGKIWQEWKTRHAF
jgi:peroxiredoxin (alkyl hydroperoxide reductase subunit C)